MNTKLVERTPSALGMAAAHAITVQAIMGRVAASTSTASSVDDLDYNEVQQALTHLTYLRDLIFAGDFPLETEGTE